MDLFLRSCGAALIAVVLVITLGKKDISMVLTMMVCCLIAGVAFRYLDPVLDLIHEIEQDGNLNGQMIGVLLKAVGIGLITEIAVLVCNDSGNTSMGKSLQILGSCVILWLSIPLFTSLLEIIKQILGEL